MHVLMIILYFETTKQYLNIKTTENPSKSCMINNHVIKPWHDVSPEGMLVLCQQVFIQDITYNKYLIQEA